MDKKILSPEELMPEYAELLCSGAELPLVVSGTSMNPFLASGSDTVRLTAPGEKPRRGDVLLFRRASGQYVLHRVIRIDGDKLWFAGDAQDELEGPVLKEQVIAQVTGVLRKGKVLTATSPTWRFYRYLWPMTVGHRKEIFTMYSGMKKHFGRNG